MKIKNIKTRNWLGKGDFDMTFNTEDNIEIITAPNAYGKTLLLNYIYDLCAGHRTPYYVHRDHFNSIEIEFEEDYMPTRGYTFNEDMHIVPSWNDSVELLPVHFLVTDHCEFKTHIPNFESTMEKFNKVISSMCLHMGDFKFEKIKDTVYFKYGDRMCSSDMNLSAGQLQFILLITTLMIMHVNNYKLLLIDDIEMNYHIAIQQHLYDIIKILKPENSQVIVTTHAPYFINNRWDLTQDIYELMRNFKE